MAAAAEDWGVEPAPGPVLSDYDVVSRIIDAC
jgi:hypothetical protein